MHPCMRAAVASAWHAMPQVHVFLLQVQAVVPRGCVERSGPEAAHARSAAGHGPCHMVGQQQQSVEVRVQQWCGL
jgi:hypothetical protein